MGAERRSGIVTTARADASRPPQVRLAHRLWRFGLVGVATTAIHSGVAMALHYWAGLPPLWANGLGFCTALVASFFGQTRLTFPEASADAAAFVRFGAVACLGFLLSQALVWAVTGPLGGPFWLGIAVVVTTVPAVTFSALKLWALRH